MTINSHDDTAAAAAAADNNPTTTVQRLREFRAKTKEQEERLAAQPKSTSTNPFPEHKEPTQDELKKHNTKPDPKSLRTNPKGGCDY